MTVRFNVIEDCEGLVTSACFQDPDKCVLSRVRIPGEEVGVFLFNSGAGGRGGWKTYASAHTSKAVSS